jgi:imidazoleglycerol phosphate synthase glutamine amidotransferase subunit HisH
MVLLRAQLRGPPEDPSVIAAVTDHGEHFVRAVARGRLLGVQFHPEKSQRAGLALSPGGPETGVTT